MANFKYTIFPNESFIDLSLMQFGYEECEPLHSYGPAVRNHFLFHCIVSGKGRLMSRVNAGRVNEYELKGGEGFLIFPGQHTTYMADAEEPWAYAWAEFDGAKAAEFVAQTGLTYDDPIYAATDGEDFIKMRDELLFLADNLKKPPLELMGHFYLFLSALIASSSKRKKTAGGNLRDFYVREALSYVEYHYKENITVEDIARACNLDRSYLSKIFKSVIDSSPKEFIIKYRVSKACELLKITNMSINEIGEEVGYANMFNFSRTFKAVMGKSPRQWRDENKLR